MKTKKINVMLAIALSLISITVMAQTAEDTPIKNIEKIIGAWKLQQVVDNNKNKKGSDKINNDTKTNAFQMIEFGPDGRYKSNTGAQAIDSGSYRLNENHGIIYLESDTDDVTPSEWAVFFNKAGAMVMTGREGDANTRRFKYVYKKTREGLGTRTNQ